MKIQNLNTPVVLKTEPFDTRTSLDVLQTEYLPRMRNCAAKTPQQRANQNTRMIFNMNFLVRKSRHPFQSEARNQCGDYKWQSYADGTDGAQDTEIAYKHPVDIEMIPTEETVLHCDEAGAADSESQASPTATADAGPRPFDEDDSPEAVPAQIVRELVDAALLAVGHRGEDAVIRRIRAVKNRSVAEGADWTWFRTLKLHTSVDDFPAAAVLSKDLFSSSAYSTVGRLFAVTGPSLRTDGQVRPTPLHPPLGLSE
jgi:hypothetical protein